MSEYINKIFSILTSNQKKKSIILLFLILFNSIIEVFGISLIFPLLLIVIDDNSINNYEILNYIFNFFSFKNSISLLNFILFLILIFFLLRYLFVITFSFYRHKFIQYTTADISQRLLEKFILSPWETFIKKNSGEMIRTIKSDVSIYANLSLLSLFNAIQETILIFSILIMLIFFNFKLTIISIVFFGFLSFLIFILLKNKTFILGRDRHFYESKKNKEMIQTLSAVKDIKVMGLEGLFIKLFNKVNYKLANIWQKQSFLNEIPKHTLELITVFFVVITIYYFISIYQLSRATILPILGLFGIAALRIIPSTGRFLSSIQNLKFSKTSTFNIYEILNNFHSKNYSNKKSLSKIDFYNEILVENIYFMHEEKNQNTLENINLKIKKGEIIGIVGQSGSGKSTLIDLILGLLKPTKGSISVDGINIDKDIDSWRNNIGYVSQNIFLLDDTIEKNISFNFEENDPKNKSKIMKLIDDVQLTKFLINLPKGLKTSVGEKGLRISGGEKQRIVIARILYNNPDVIIFDESTSALDIDIEKKIIDLICNIKGKTIIIISHRSSTLQKCDKIFRLRDKNIFQEK